ncbi:hypothetical protein ACNKHT_00085 [Shigella flexneri]
MFPSCLSKLLLLITATHRSRVKAEMAPPQISAEVLKKMKKTAEDSG